MNAVAYIWRGLINCFYLFVILYVFDNIQDKNTSIIIAVLALLYTTMRTIAGGQALTVLAMGRGLHEEFADLKVKMGHEPVPISDDSRLGILPPSQRVDKMSSWLLPRRSFDFVIDNFSGFSERLGGGRCWHRRGQPQSVFIVYGDNETGLACEIESMEMVSLGLEDHGLRSNAALKSAIAS